MSPDSPNISLLDRLDAVFSTRRALATLCGITFLLKLLYVLQSASALYVTVPIMDSAYYLRMANSILADGALRDQPFFMGPLYPYVLAVIMSVLGKSLMAIRIVQIAVGTLTVGLTFLAGRTVFRPTTAMVGAAMTALYGAMTFYEGQFLMMWLGTFLNILALLVLHRFPGNRGLQKYVVTGFLVGLSALARANILIFLPLIVAWIVFVSGEPRRLLKCLVVTAAVVVTILPATVHNYLAAGEWIPITSNGGVNFYIGNNEQARGIFAPPKGINLVTDDAVKKFVERELGRDMSDGEISRYWYDEAFAFIRSNPGKEMLLLARKTAMFFNGYEVPQIEAYQIARTRHGTLRILFVNFWMIVSVGLFGMVMAAKEWRRRALFYGYVFSFALSIILFFVTARYRTQIAPVMCLFAAYAIVEIFPAAVGNVRAHLRPLALLAFLIAATQPGWAALPEEDVAWREHTHEARRLAEIGRYAEAIEEAGKAVSIHPDYADSYIQRAVIQKERGRNFEAISDYSKALDLNPDLASVHYDLAQTLRRVKMLQPAVESYHRAILLRPNMLEAYNNLGITYSEMGDKENAIRTFRRAIEIDPRRAKAYNNLGVTLAEGGDVDGAIEVFLEAIDVEPTYSVSYKNLAMSYLQKGRVTEALALLENYVARDPNDRHAQDTLSRLREALQADSTLVPK